VISLGPGVDRRALVFTMRLDRQGRCVDKRIERARVRSRVKLAFGHVQAFYDGGPLVDVHGAAVTDSAVLTSLRELADVGKRRLTLADERHVVPFRRVEVQVDVGARGFIALEDPRYDVERYNEQISLLCNVEGGELLKRAAPHVQAIWRVHQPPSGDRLQSLAARIDELVGERGLPASFRWSPADEGLDGYLRRLPHDRVAAAIHRQAMVGGGGALFTAVPGAHAGIGADVYARFTAPMREVVGIFVHGEALETEGGPAFGDEALRDQVIASASRARDTQRRLDHAVNRLVLDALLAEMLEKVDSASAASLLGGPEKIGAAAALYAERGAAREAAGNQAGARADKKRAIELYLEAARLKPLTEEAHKTLLDLVKDVGRERFPERYQRELDAIAPRTGA